MYRQSEKNLLSSNISSTCPHNMVNFGPLTAEIGWQVWGTPSYFNGYRVLAALLHGSQVVSVSQTLRVEQRAPPMFGRATIRLGIGPHSSGVSFSFLAVSTAAFWCFFFLSRNFHPCIFDCAVVSCLAFSVDPLFPCPHDTKKSNKQTNTTWQAIVSSQ